MAQVTATDVFDFMGTEEDIRAENTDAVNGIIARAIVEIENAIGRKIEETAFTNVLFENGRNCEIIEDMMFLKGQYRDILTISSLSESGSALNPVVDSNDNGDYYFDNRTGYVKRVYQNWSQLQNAIKISGTLGLVDESGDTKADLKGVIIELAAVRSGLWKKYYNGQEYSTNDITIPSKMILESYKRRDV